MSLLIFYALILMLVMAYYLFCLRHVTPISMFVAMFYAYAVAPILFGLLDYHFFNIVIDRYRVYEASDLVSGAPYVVVFLLVLMAFDWFLVKRSLCFPPVKNLRSCSAWLCFLVFLFMFLCMMTSLFGIAVFGVKNFFYGYANSDLDHASLMTRSPGWSLYTNGAIFFYMLSIPAFLMMRHKYVRCMWWLMMSFFVALNLYGGARLITLTAVAAIFFAHNNFSVRISVRLFFSLFIFVTVFVLVGLYRGGGAGVGLLYPFLEFSFVGFGFYNLIAVRDSFEVHLLEFLNDIFIFSLPGYFVDKSNLFRADLILSNFPSFQWLSPIGGNFLLTDLYLYFGVFTFFVIFFVVLVMMLLVYFLSRLRSNNFYLLYYTLIMWVFTFGAVWVVRNQILVFFSLLFKFIFFFLFLIIVSRTYKIFLKGKV